MVFMRKIFSNISGVIPVTTTRCPCRLFSIVSLRASSAGIAPAADDRTLPPAIFGVLSNPVVGA